MIIHIKTLSEIDSAAAKFLDAVKGYDVIAFYGEMGAGKTTFINAITRQLGVVDDAVNSPSFSIVNEYRTASGDTIYHFDLYRLASVEEALAIGVEDYFYSGSFIEPLLPDDTLRVGIVINDDDSREIKF